VGRATVTGFITLSGVGGASVSFAWKYMPPVRTVRPVQRFPGMAYGQSVSVYRRNGVWGFTGTSDSNFIATCQVFYPAGVNTVITAGAAADLIAAGLTPTYT
jgi:hypothetical protein